MKPDRESIGRVTREAVEHLDERIAASDARARGRAAFLAKVREGDVEAQTFAWLAGAWRVGLLAAMVVGTVIVAALVFWPHPAPLSFTVAGARGSVGDWIGTYGGRPVALEFSDGSELVLERGSDARVTSLDTKGARVALEHGELHAAVRHTGTSRWSVSAGPYEVRVTGTQFVVAWDPTTQRLSLDLQEGSVVIAGCELGERKLKAGEAVRARCAGETALAPAPAPVPTPASALPPAPAPAPEPATGTAAPTATPTPTTDTTPTSWADLAAAGRYREAFARVEGDYDSRCASAPPGDLLVLADVARYAGDEARAKKAWLALRDRFPGDARAASAAFFLGRAAFDEGAFAEAKRWFGVSRAEAPAGPLAREAAGRLIEACQRAGDGDGAREAARKYLREYPTGPHARLADSVAH